MFCGNGILNCGINVVCFFLRLELAILNLQKKEAKVAVVYDLLHLIWKTYHMSGKSKRELYALGEELGVNMCSPSGVKGTRWIPHIHRALKVFLRHGEGKNLANDHDQYSVVLQHMEHLSASESTSAEVQGRAKKVCFLVIIISHTAHKCQTTFIINRRWPGEFILN